MLSIAHSLDGQVTHLNPEDNPWHLLPTNLKFRQDVYQQTCTKKLGKPEPEIQDPDKEESRCRKADDMLGRR